MRLFEKVRRVKLGVTRPSIARILQEMEKVSPIDEVATELLAINVMATLQHESSDEWCEADKVGFDWDSLLEFISMLIEMLMPFIVKQRPPIPVYTYEK
ncbi:MAG: hypothetical protein V3U39_12285 [Acidimicrobiia bacterium]